MTNFLKGIESTKGKSFATQKQNINRKGRPRKTISAVNLELEKAGFVEVSSNDIKSCYLRLINLDLKTLKEMSSNQEQPAMVRIVGKSILSGRGFDVIEKMLDRSIGKAEQKVQMDVSELKPLEFTIIKNKE